MAAKRIFQLAKELGVDSKVMVAKCQAEEIPNITNHMSVVPIGLEATLREWFSGSSEGNVTTTVEATEKVDIAQARAKAPRSRKAKASDSTEEGGPATTTSLEQDAAAVRPVTEPKPAPATVVQAGPITDPTLTKAKPITPTIGTPAVSPTPARAAPIRPAAAPAEVAPPAT
ncbi:MAG: Translation initiation factor, partial [Planctomycetota bacterium]